MPYTRIYIDIVVGPSFPPDINLSPWYPVEQWVTWLLLVVYIANCANRKYRQGETGDARALAVAMGIFLCTILWDNGNEYGLIDTVLMARYGYVAFIIIMSLRFAAQPRPTSADVSTPVCDIGAVEFVYDLDERLNEKIAVPSILKG